MNRLEHAELRKLLRQEGTVRVAATRRCDVCHRAAPELAIRSDDGEVRVYHWECLEKEVGTVAGYGTWERQFIVLTCGHRPSKLRLRDAVGYCPRCGEWNWIDEIQTGANIRAAKKRHGQSGAKAVEEG